ncbi:hypothetical protein [Protaetiibacter intestinalis]|uniref:Uncharacterized protein n=1 Tax=Protaetiibacter intestinalis TaxID=2419774 RepID=A0A387B7U2_9MICO|nr:hypothetical protein [Protaetiibacter intestinalis]AYF98413.1 hypothetical protein D7I47_09170 [Protaetiibacter intestinalis]
MPLETQRPGIFRGERRNNVAWYVTDPARAAEIEAEWRANFEPTNRRGGRRVLAAVIRVVLFGGVVAAALVWAFLSGMHAGLATVVLIVAVLAGAALAGVVNSLLVPRGRAAVARVEGVLPIDDDVVAWAGDGIRHEDLWRLTVGLSRLRQLHEAVEAVERDDDDGDEAPIELAGVTELRGQYAAERDAFHRLALSLGYPLPDEFDEAEDGERTPGVA